MIRLRWLGLAGGLLSDWKRGWDWFQLLMPTLLYTTDVGQNKLISAIWWLGWENLLWLAFPYLPSSSVPPEASKQCTANSNCMSDAAYCVHHITCTTLCAPHGAPCNISRCALCAPHCTLCTLQCTLAHWAHTIGCPHRVLMPELVQWTSNANFRKIT